MDIQEYTKRYREIEKETEMPCVVSDDDLAKMYVSHIVIAEWQIKQQEELFKREVEKEKRRESMKKSLMSGRY